MADLPRNIILQIEAATAFADHHYVNRGFARHHGGQYDHPDPIHK